MSFKKFLSIGFLLIIIALAAGACNLSGDIGSQAARDTQVVETVNAYQTKSAFETIVMEITQGIQPTVTQTQAPPLSANTNTSMPPMATSTESPVPPTATSTETPVPPTPTSTETPVPPTPTLTYTPLPPTATYTPLPPTATSTPLPCNWGELVKDVTVPDGTVIYPESVFVKTWRLKNVGSCSWTKDYSVVFSSGSQMEATSPVKLGVTVNPGGTVDISLRMKAPASVDTYKGEWMLRNEDNVLFGVGSNAKVPFWVSIKVQKRPDFNADNKLDFTKNVNAVTWKSMAGILSPGSSYEFEVGSVSLVSAPKLEDGYQDDEPAIVVVPNDGSDGRVWGRYPAIEIKDGDRFVTVIGCTSDYKKCDVTFKLNYIVDGSDQVNLGTWKQVYDDKWDKLNIDLSALKGKNVEFILIVESNGDSLDDVAFWLSPRIVR